MNAVLPSMFSYQFHRNGVLYTYSSLTPDIVKGDDGSVLFDGLYLPPPAREIIDVIELRKMANDHD